MLPVIGAAAITIGAGSLALAQSVSVTLNGTPMNLNPAPQERAGRIFVPLRGIFEQLGASVVYQNGLINAQGHGREVSLHIGSTQATVDGQPQTLDVAPFVVGASTYVPLRFVSQALGASVNYDATNKIVAISAGNAGPSAAPPPGSGITLGPLEPGRDADVPTRRPTIAAQFAGGRVDPNSLRITLDDLDITASTSRSPSGFVYSPPSDLQSMRHVVHVRGADMSGAPFEARWSFMTGTSSVVTTLRDVNPPDGAQVPGQFTVSGHTLPRARVIVQVGSPAGGGPAGNPNSIASDVGAIFGLGGGVNVRTEVEADDDGFFSTVVATNAPPGTPLQMVVSATDPRSKAAARPVRRNLSVR